jgi:hypothetical protein
MKQGTGRDEIFFHRIILEVQKNLFIFAKNM